jgi:DUF917 family protein
VPELTSPEDVEDFIRGADFLSANGGGEPIKERERLLEDLKRGLTLGWSPLEEFTDDALICTAAFSGSIAPEAMERHGIDASIVQGQKVERPLVAAIEALERELQRPIDGLISIEIGGSNVGAILDAAAVTGKRLVDADYAGRAIPELGATTLDLYGVPVLPEAFADDFGNELITRRAASNGFAERISKHLAKSSFGVIASALAALPAKTVSEISVPGTLSECLALGRAIRTAREAGSDPVVAAADALDGWVLFRGRIAERTWENTEYLEGFHTIAGVDQYAGRNMKLWFKNENHLSWIDGKPYVASPDLLEVCDADTAEPLSNTYLKVGDRVAVVGMRRRDVWDSEQALQSLGPPRFGWHEFPFQPIEQLVALDKN